MKPKNDLLKSLMLLVLALFTVLNAGAAERKVTIKVMDTTHDPLPGAVISIINATDKKEKPIGVTDAEGVFSFALPADAEAIEANFLGYQPKKAAIGDASEYILILTPATNQLDDVVVTGYQTISKERTTGSFAKIERKEIETKPMTSLSNLLDGEVAGYNDGVIRGVTSMRSNATPLYVIDGFPVENTRMDVNGSLTEYLPNLNIEDIENITVLKDAAATSIYGARAANGVIVITTKIGKKTNKAIVNVNAQLTWTPYKQYFGNKADSKLMTDLQRQWAAVNPHLHDENSAEYAQACLDLRTYPGAGFEAILNYYAGNSTKGQMESTLDDLSKRGYQMYDQIKRYTTRTRLDQQYNVTVTNGTNNNNFKSSVTYTHNALNNIYSNGQSVGIDIFNSTKIFNWLTFDIGTYLLYSQNETGLGSAWYWDGMPYDRIVNDDGSKTTLTMKERYNKDLLAMYERYDLLNMDVTPLDEVRYNRGKTKQLHNRTIARLNINFTPWLYYTASFQYERGYEKYRALYDSESQYIKGLVNNWSQDSGNEDGSVIRFFEQKDKLNVNNQDFQNYNFRQQLTLDRRFADVHSVTAILGTETRENKINVFKDEYYEWDEQLLTFKNLDYQTLGTKGVTGIFGKQTLNDARVFNEYTNRFFSIYGNAAYGYDSRYNLTASMRWDRSNLWGTGNKYQKKPFWSVGASWQISNEKFFNVSWIQYLKLRISDGVGGNIAKEASPYIIANYGYNYNVDATSGYVLRLPNNSLSWEKTNTFNVGIDFGLFNHRLNGTIEYYNKKSSDLMFYADGTPISGYGSNSNLVNSASMLNRGVEITLNGDIIRSQDWTWSAGLTYAHNHNKVTEVYVTCPYMSYRLQSSTAYPLKNTALYSLYGFKYAGLDEKGLPQIYDGEGNIIQTMPGSSDFDALENLGQTTPVWNGSFNTQVRWRDLTLSALFTFAGGHKARNTTVSPFLGYSQNNYGYATDITSASPMLKHCWQQPGDEKHTDIPRLIFGEEGDYDLSNLKNIYFFSSANILNMDYLKLANLALTYRLPKEWCQKVCLGEVRIQGNIENPFFWAHNQYAKYQLGGYNAAKYTLGVFVSF